MYCPAVFKKLTIYLSFVFKGIWTGIFFGSPSSEWDPSTTGANWGQSGVSLHGVVMFVMSVLVRISVVSGMKQLRTGYTIFSEHEEIVKCVFRRMSIPGVYDNLFCLKTCKCKHWLSFPFFQEDAQDLDALCLAKSYFDLKEYDRAAYFLRGCRSQKAYFLYMYSRYLVRCFTIVLQMFSIPSLWRWNVEEPLFFFILPVRGKEEGWRDSWQPW